MIRSVRKCLYTALAAAIASATPAMGADAPSEQVTVTAAHWHDKARRDEAVSTFLSIHSRPAYTGHFTRWAEPVCPHVDGLPGGYDVFIVKRILAIAAQAGIPANQACVANAAKGANVQVLFSPDPQHLADYLASHQRYLLGYTHNPSAIAKFDGPIDVWYATRTRTPSGAVFLDREDRPGPAGEAGSHISDRLSSEFANVLVLADRNAVAGAEIGQIADYLSLMVLMQVDKAQRCSAMPTILNLYASDCKAGDKPAGATMLDIAYLKALYSIDPELNEDAAKGAIATRITQILDKQM